jgi:hypothetical protein
MLGSNPPPLVNIKKTRKRKRKSVQRCHATEGQERGKRNNLIFPGHKKDHHVQVTHSNKWLVNQCSFKVTQNKKPCFNSTTMRASAHQLK